MGYCQKHSFRIGMKFWLIICFFGLFIEASAQEKQAHAAAGQVEGIIFDKDTKDRVAHVNIVNTNTNKSFYNDLKGQFKIDAKQGDQLIFIKQDYLPDTVIIKSNANIAVYLQRFAIPLREVTIHDSLGTPQKRLAATKRDYTKIYGSSAYNDPLSISPGGGAGISIDALFNSISRSGRNAERLRGVIQGDYEQNVINFRFNRTFVGNVTGLKDQELTEFMIRYRPGYYMVTTASEYDFITYIRNNLRRYKRNKRTFSVPPLTPAKDDEAGPD